MQSISDDIEVPVGQFNVFINLNDGKKAKRMKNQKQFEAYLKMFGYSQDHVIEILEAEVAEEKKDEHPMEEEKTPAKVEPLKAEPVKAAEAKEDIGCCSKGHKLIDWVGMPDDPAYRRANPSCCICSICNNYISYADHKGFRRCGPCQYDAHHECQEAVIKRKVEAARKPAEAKKDNGQCFKGHKLIDWFGMPDDPDYRRANPSNCICSICNKNIHYADPKGFRRCGPCQYDAHHECQEAAIKRKAEYNRPMYR